MADIIEEGPKRPITTGEHKMFTSFAGVDTRVRIDGETHGQIQAISFCRYKDTEGQWQVAGTIIRLVLDEGCGTLPEKFSELQVLATNEYGSSALAFGLKDIEIVSCSSGIGIDDIVVEETYNYVAKEFVPGRKLTTRDFENARIVKSVHTKHIEFKDDEAKKQLIAKALEITKEEPSEFISDLAKVLDRHRVML